MVVAFAAVLAGAVGQGRAAEPQKVVFIGDSITEGWPQIAPAFFEGKPYVPRGVSGQTSLQILARFQRDVLDQKPAAVVILAGTNDIAENGGPYDAPATRQALEAMCALARGQGIRVVIASLLPTVEYPWNTGRQPAPKIVELNAFLKELAAKQGAVYLDYYAALVDEHGGLRTEFSPDGVHPNAKGYAVMAPLAEEAIRSALARMPTS